jgi:hypothetical protein
MRLRSRRRNLIILSTRAFPAYQPPPYRVARRRFRSLRLGALLMVVGVMRLARIVRSRWRLSIGLSGILLEVIGHTLLSGPAQSAADLIGLVVILYALLRNPEPASARGAGIPQAAWRHPG